MISVAVLTVTLVPAMQSSMGAQRLNAQAVETQQGLRVLDNARHLLGDATIAELADVGGTLAPGQPLVLPGGLDNQTVTYEILDWTAGDPLPDVLSYRLRLDWTSERGNPRFLTLVDAQR